MRTAVVLGGSVIGSATAILLARKGWQVTVVDAELPRFVDPGAEVAVRPGAPHAVQAHGFPARGPYELRTRLPDVWEALVDAGAERWPVQLPPPLLDGGRPGDADLESMRVRRVLLDAVLARAARSEPGVTVVTAKATGLVLEPGAVPRVAGLGLEDGRALLGDLVVDAAGRRSPVAGWLAESGFVQPERVDPCGMAYYGRHYRITGPRPPLNLNFAEVHEFPTFNHLMFLGDNDSAQMALSPHVDDPLLKSLRHEGAYEAVLAANEAFAPWLEVLEPQTGIFCLGSLANRMRSLVVDGRPLVEGLVQVGDALAMTNPNRGRGIGMGLAAVGALVDLVDGAGPDPVAYDAWQRSVLAVQYREAAAVDEMYGRRFRAHLVGESAPANAPAVELPEGHPFTSHELEQVAGADPDLFRAFLRAVNMLDDDREIASPATADVVRRLRSGDAPPPGPPAPRPRALEDRAFLERLLAPYA